MSRKDLKELGEQLDEGQAGLIVVGASDMEGKIEGAMKKADKREAKKLKADNAAIEKDAKESSQRLAGTRWRGHPDLTPLRRFLLTCHDAGGTVRRCSRRAGAR